MKRLGVHERDISVSMHIGEVPPGFAVRGMVSNFRGINLRGGLVDTGDDILVFGLTEPVRMFSMLPEERRVIFAKRKILG